MIEEKKVYTEEEVAINFDTGKNCEGLYRVTQEFGKEIAQVLEKAIEDAVTTGCGMFRVSVNDEENIEGN